MNTPATKLCSHCGIEKPLSEMDSFRRKGKLYYRRRCRACNTKGAKKYAEANPQKRAQVDQRKYENLRRRRQDPNERPYFILTDTRASDRKQGLTNDLDADFIRNLIQNGCSYCGETELQMTLDRIDNEKGHTEDNVVPACIRCNYSRRDMPYEAWCIVAKGMAEARQQGLFGTWTGRVNQHRGGVAARRNG